MKQSNPSRLLVIGDSHVSVWRGLIGLAPITKRATPSILPHIDVLHLGPFLAHSVCSTTHRANKAVARAINAHAGPVLMVFGEIDCRCHVAKQSVARGESVDSIARELGESYARAAKRLAKGRKFALCAASPTTHHDVYNPQYPIIGSWHDRFLATRAFNRALQASTLPVLDVAKHASRKGKQRPEFFPDHVHLSVNALPVLARELAALKLLPTRAQADLTIACEVAASAQSSPAIALSAPAPIVAGPSPAIVTQLVDRAARECVMRGASTIAIMGAGQHTRRIGLEGFQRHGLSVAAILDDNPREQSLLGVPVLMTSRAPRVDAIVISSDAHEDALTNRIQQEPVLRGVAIVRIYAAAVAN